MKVPAKITLSVLEQQLVEQPDWILAKNEVIRKAVLLFGQIAENFQQHPAHNHLPDIVKMIAPKISKGENYQGLPYVVLDYPRFFQREDVLAIRSFFWWGHFFSCTIQLKGRYYDLYAEQVFKYIQLNHSIQWFINRSDEEWVHDLHDNLHWGYLKPDSVFEKNKNKLLKISGCLSVSKWEDALAFFKETGSVYLSSLVDHQFPKR